MSLKMGVSALVGPRPPYYSRYRSMVLRGIPRPGEKTQVQRLASAKISAKPGGQAARGPTREPPEGELNLSFRPEPRTKIEKIEPARLTWEEEEKGPREEVSPCEKARGGGGARALPQVPAKQLPPSAPPFWPCRRYGPIVIRL